MTASPYSDTLRAGLNELDRAKREAEATKKYYQEYLDRLSRGVLTTKEAAAILGCHPRTVLRLIASGELPGFRVRRHWRVLGRDVYPYAETFGSTLEGEHQGEPT